MGLKPIIPPRRETRLAGAGWGPVKTAKPFSKYEACFKFEGRAVREGESAAASQRQSGVGVYVPFDSY